MTKYQPVSCELHSELELAIMHNQALQIRVHTDVENETLLQLKPLDIITRDKEEYLKGIQPDETVIEIRLDHIIEHTTDF